MIGVLFLSSIFGFAVMLAAIASGMPVAMSLLIWPLAGTSGAMVLFAERAFVPIVTRDRRRPPSQR